MISSRFTVRIFFWKKKRGKCTHGLLSKFSVTHEVQLFTLPAESVCCNFFLSISVTLTFLLLCYHWAIVFNTRRKACSLDTGKRESLSNKLGLRFKGAVSRNLPKFYTTSSPHFSSGIVEREKRERTWKSPHARMIFTRARVSLALLSLRKNGDYS